MKSVNHRYLDVNIKMPKKLNFFESAIRSELKNYISRGKVDLFITYEDFSENTSNVRYNKELAAEYLGYLKQMASDFDLDCDIRVSTLSKYPDVFVMEEQDIGRTVERTAESPEGCLRDVCTDQDHRGRAFKR
jgi:uncharacterized protein (TIGR00255 family)